LQLITAEAGKMQPGMYNAFYVKTRVACLVLQMLYNGCFYFPLYISVTIWVGLVVFLLSFLRSIVKINTMKNVLSSVID